MDPNFQATVVVATFGSQVWSRLALRRAIPSARTFGVPVIHEHCSTLAEARNAGLAKVETEWVIHLDADDELEPGYIEAMADGSADCRVPSVRYIFSRFRTDGEPIVPRVAGHDHECVGECLRYGNWCVVGSAVRAEMARSVGGWEEFGWSEDWAMWARCWKAGASFEAIPEAVYRAYKRPGSRNRQPRSKTIDWHRQIEAAVWPEEASVL